jgi:hypothetical protein
MMKAYRLVERKLSQERKQHNKKLQAEKRFRPGGIQPDPNSKKQQKRRKKQEFIRQRREERKKELAAQRTA